MKLLNKKKGFFFYIFIFILSKDETANVLFNAFLQSLNLVMSGIKGYL